MLNATHLRARWPNGLLAASLFTAVYHLPAAAGAPPQRAAASAPANDVAEEMVVTARAPALKAGSDRTITADDLQRKGANDFGSIMRYEPLISATGASGGSGNGKSGFDRGGYTGYNIRGLESNRVGIDIDGIPTPNATGRSYVSRRGNNTFGIGRDYIDPYMYGNIRIHSGATPVDSTNTSIGGSVSFLPKSPDAYLGPDKRTYFGYQTDYDSDDRSLHHGITGAAGDDALRGIFVYSRRDGQESRIRGRRDAYPANWHSDAAMASGIWQPNDQHKLTGTVDYYHKANHTHYDSWDNSGNAITGTAQQTGQSRRWGTSLKDDWTPMSDWLDGASTKLYYQHTEAHDRTFMPDSMFPRVMQTVYSDYDTDTWGLTNALNKTLGRHALSAGFNASTAKTKRPFSQSPIISPFTEIMQPEANSRSYTLGGFAQDKIGFDLGGRDAAMIPGVRVAHQSIKPRSVGSLTTNSSVLTADQISHLYEKNSDTKVLPSLTLQYSLAPRLLTYVEYRRGAQFPNASQLFGSWNMGSSYAGQAQYALIGNSDLKTETSNNLEWGLKGDVLDGVTVSASLFYNTYRNFIAYTRYTRAGNPAMFSRVPPNIYTTYQAENRDKAYIRGGEITTRIRYGTWFNAADGLSTVLSYGYSEGKSKSSYAGDKYVDLDSVPPMKAIAGMAWDDPNGQYGTALTATFVKGKRAEMTTREAYSNGGRPLAKSSGRYERVSGYGLLDWTAYWQVAKRVKFNGGIYNVTDRKYRDYLNSRTQELNTAQDASDRTLSVMPGRTWQLGVNVDF